MFHHIQAFVLISRREKSTKSVTEDKKKMKYEFLN